MRWFDPAASWRPAWLSAVPPLALALPALLATALWLRSRWRAFGGPALAADRHGLWLVVGLSLLILFQTAPGRAIERLLPITYAIPAVILAQFSVACAFAVRTMRVSFDQISPRREQVARTLGCTRGQAFWRVVLPEARGGMVTAATVSWARALGEFGPILVFAGATRMRTAGTQARSRSLSRATMAHPGSPRARQGHTAGRTAGTSASPAPVPTTPATPARRRSRSSTTRPLLP